MSDSADKREIDIVSSSEVTESVEQLGKDIIVGRKEARYEDGRNVISVIINAISVRINMPRGTVKALLACFAALLLVAVVWGISLMPAKEAEQPAEETAQTEEVPVAEEPEGVLSLKDYVNISDHFYYQLPDNVQDIWYPEDAYARNETFCEFTDGGDLYSIRTYVLDWQDEDLADTVKADMMLFDNMKIIDEEYVDGKYGEMLKIRFEALDEESAPVVGIGWYWYESGPEICCLEVATDEWRDGSVEERVMDSIYRVSSGSTEPYSVDEGALDEANTEEAMDSLAQDAMREQYQTAPDPSDRVIKP